MEPRLRWRECLFWTFWHLISSQALKLRWLETRAMSRSEVTMDGRTDRHKYGSRGSTNNHFCCQVLPGVAEWQSKTQVLIPVSSFCLSAADSKAVIFITVRSGWQPAPVPLSEQADTFKSTIFTVNYHWYFKQSMQLLICLLLTRVWNINAQKYSGPFNFELGLHVWLPIVSEFL